MRLVETSLVGQMFRSVSSDEMEYHEELLGEWMELANGTGHR
jgi:hypothetical protein